MRPVRNCEYCGKEFIPKRSDQMCCSTSHRLRSNARKFRKANPRSYQKQKCVICGVEIKQPKRKTCCTEHAAEYRRRCSVKNAAIRDKDLYDESGDIAAAREACGLKPLEPGRIQCRSCGAMFDSWDVKKNILCELCSQDHEAIELLGGVAYGRPVL